MSNIRRPWLMALPAVLILLVGTVVLLWRAHVAEASANTRKTNGGSVWGADYFPNVPLVTHEGKSVHFFDDLIKDKVVAINFIYTTCPDTCPMETARLLQVQQLLGDRMGKDVFFYSVTIDPETDTVPVIKKYADDWHFGPGWKLLTGKEEDITKLRKKLGVYIEEIQADDSNDHNVSLLIGNQATGRWMKRSPFENPYVLAKQIGGELHNWKLASKTELDYAEAPELRSISKGESLFRTRCQSCHTIGDGDIVELDARRIGPDLYNVTQQRDRAWLERWMAAPDDMLAAKDPLATALLAQYNNVPMPNLQLNPVEIKALLEHIEETSKQIAKHVAMGHRKDPRAVHHTNQAMNHEAMDHEAMDHGAMDHGAMDHSDGMEHSDGMH